MDEEAARRRVLEIADELRSWWLAGLNLRADREVWDSLAPTLTGHHSLAGTIIGGWYRDAVLIRCRRLLAEGNDYEESPRRTLARLAEAAGHVTVEVLADAWIAQGTTLDRELVVEQVNATLDRAEADGHDPLNPATVEADARRLEEDYRTIRRFTSRAIAHQDRRRGRAEPPTVAEVDRLIEDVLAIVQRYAAVFAGVHLDTEGPRLSIRPTVRAIELFDWPTYVEAVGDEEVRRYAGEPWPSQAREAVEAEVELRYVWPPAEA
jgi:hypothetical protein